MKEERKGKKRSGNKRKRALTDLSDTSLSPSASISTAVLGPAARTLIL